MLTHAPNGWRTRDNRRQPMAKDHLNQSSVLNRGIRLFIITCVAFSQTTCNFPVFYVFELNIFQLYSLHLIERFQFITKCKYIQENQYSLLYTCGSNYIIVFKRWISQKNFFVSWRKERRGYNRVVFKFSLGTLRLQPYVWRFKSYDVVWPNGKKTNLKRFHLLRQSEVFTSKIAHTSCYYTPANEVQGDILESLSLSVHLSVYADSCTAHNHETMCRVHSWSRSDWVSDINICCWAFWPWNSQYLIQLHRSVAANILANETLTTYERCALNKKTKWILHLPFNISLKLFSCRVYM